MTTERRFIAGVLEHRGAFLVRQRAHGIVNAHLWEFPNVEVPIKSPANAARASLEAELGYTLESFSPFMTVKHSITRYRITLEAFRGEVNGDRPRVAAGKWVAKRKLEKLPFTVAHRRVLSAFLKNAGGG
jgi:adenine-specific DNA glycosylase